MKRSILILTLTTLLLAVGTSAYCATFADTYGMSPQGMSMGNAMTAHVNDWSSVYYNVAGLGRTAQNLTAKDKPAPVEVFIGYLNTQPQPKLDIPARYSVDSNGETTYYSTNADQDLDYGSYILGATIDLNMFYDLESIPPHALSSCRLGIAMGINDDLSVAKVSDLEPQTHNYLRYGREAQQLTLLTGLGMGFLDDMFGVGIGVRSSFGGNGRVLLDGVQVSTEEQKPSQQNYMDLKLESSLVAGLYVDLNDLDLGFSYRQESKMKIDPFQTATITAVGNIPLNLALSILDYYQPTSYTGGISYRFTDRLMLAFDVEFQKWSDYEVSSNQQVNWGSILPKLDDIWIPKIGMQYDATPKTALYLGYYYQPSFVPNNAVTGSVNWLDNDKHVGSVGVSYKVGKFLGFKVPMALHAGYQLQYLVDRTVTKSEPTSMNPSYSYGGMVHTIMVGFSL
ncbi:MAG: outer membrane protein transport protein [Desulfobacteraceae bacterium]|nr:outer membrane protein transport protein [Desulfobacteraceae bacterium]